MLVRAFVDHHSKTFGEEKTVPEWLGLDGTDPFSHVAGGQTCLRFMGALAADNAHNFDNDEEWDTDEEEVVENTEVRTQLDANLSLLTQMQAFCAASISIHKKIGRAHV